MLSVLWPESNHEGDGGEKADNGDAVVDGQVPVPDMVVVVLKYNNVEQNYQFGGESTLWV